VEDGPASFRIFLAVIFLALVWARGAAMLEVRFRLGVDFAEPGWIRMMAFDGGGAFLSKRTTGATGENKKMEPSSLLGSGPSSCCRENKWN
jgi:hypothetical protein